LTKEHDRVATVAAVAAGGGAADPATVIAAATSPGPVTASRITGSTLLKAMEDLRSNESYFPSETDAVSKKEAVRYLKADIRNKLKKGFPMSKVVEILRATGISISQGTLRTYLKDLDNADRPAGKAASGKVPPPPETSRDNSSPSSSSSSFTSSYPSVSSTATPNPSAAASFSQEKSQGGTPSPELSGSTLEEDTSAGSPKASPPSSGSAPAPGGSLAADGVKAEPDVAPSPDLAPAPADGVVAGSLSPPEAVPSAAAGKGGGHARRKPVGGDPAKA
jgi:hypothetical protein